MTNSTGQITSSGSAADNGASSTYAELTDTNNTDGTSSQTQIQSSGPIAQSQTNYAGANETGGITSTSDWLANTAAGVSDNTGISNATVYVPTLVLGNIGGGNDTIQLSGLDTLGLQGSNDTVTDTVGGVTVNLGSSLSESFSGVIGDQLTLSGGDTVNATGGGLIANLSGTANAFTGYGDTANILTAGSTQTLYGNDTIDSAVAATALIAANFTDTLNGIAGDTVDLAGGDIFTSTTWGVSAYLTGHNVFTGSGDTAYLLTLSQGNTIYGNDTIDAEAAGTVAIGINDTDTLTGVSGDVVDLAGGDIFTSTTGGISAYLTGHNVFTGSGDTAYLLTLSQGNTIYGNDTIDAEAAGTVAIGINDTDTLTGVSGDVVDLAGGDIFTSTTGGISAYLTGHNVFTGSGDTAYLLTPSQGNTINGNDTIDAEAAGTVAIGINDTDTLTGVSGDVVDLAGGDIFTSTTGGLSAYLTGHNVFTGSGDTAYLLTPSQGNTIYGNDTIDAEAAGTVAIGINDTDTLTGVSGDVVDLAGGDIFTSTTGGLSAYLTGHNVFTGSGDTAYLLTPSQGNTIYGNDTIDAEAAGTVAIGINDTDTLTGVSGDVVDLAGGDIFTSTTGGLSAYLTGHNVFTGSGDTAYLLTPSQGNTINGNDTIDAEAAGTVAIGINDTDTLTGVSGDVVDLAGGDVATCNGAGLTANLTGSDVVTLSGSGDVTNLLSSGDASTVNLASACSLSLNGSGASFFMSPGDIVNVTASESGLATDIGYGVAGDKAIFSDSTLGNSQFQEVEPSAATLLEYSDYSGLDATGKLENTTLDNTNGTSATTWYNPTGYANVIQATDQFTAVDDGGNLTSEVFTTTANQTYDDSFVYNAGQITDVWQEVSVTSTGVELADDEFNDAGTLVDEVFGYAAGYQVTTGYAYSYAIHSPGAGTQAETHQRPAELALRGVARTSVFDTGSHGRSAASPYAGPGAPAVPVAAASPYSAASVAKNPSPGAAPASSNAASGSALAATEPVVSTAPHFIDGSGAGGNEHSIATPVTAGFVADDPSNASSSGYSAPSSLHDIATGPAGDPAELAWYGAPQPPTPDSAGQARSDRAGMVGLFARYGYAATFVHDLAPFVHVA